jgi:hypothetical protein
MIRGLTIRFGVMCLGAVPLVAFLNRVEPAPGLVTVSVVLYTFGGGLLLARYCVAHEDEIPSRPPRDTHHR